MAKTTAKPKAKSRASKPVAKRKAAVSQTPAYSQMTWSPVVLWLGLVAIFLGLIIFKLYVG